jgi:hypothetical protein
MAELMAELVAETGRERAKAPGGLVIVQGGLVIVQLGTPHLARAVAL